MTIDLTNIEKKVLFLCLSLATFMIILDYSIANVSIPYIAGNLGASVDQGTYVITSFAVGNAIGLSMTGWLTKRVGEIKLYVLSISLFTLISWLCGASVNLTMLVICRCLQGFVAGPIIPLSQSLLISTGSPATRSRDLAIWTTIIVTAPVAGPVLGGYLSDWYSWTWIFYINIPIGVFCAFVIWAIMRRYETAIEKVATDIPGMILLALGVLCLQVLLDKGQQWDWMNSNVIRMLGIGTIVCFTLLLIRELTHKNPFLDLRLFAFPSFSLSIVSLAVSYAIYFGTIVLVPLWLQQYMGYNAVWAGIAVCSLGIGPVLFSMITPKMIKRIGNLRTLMFGFSLFAAACFYGALFTTEVDLQHLSLSRFVFGVAIVFYINPLIGMSVEDIPAASLPSAAGIFHFVRAMVGGIGTSVFTTLWERRTIFHHERIGSMLTSFNPSTPKVTDERSIALLNNAMDQQAAMLSINDTFYLMGWLFIGLIVLLGSRFVYDRYVRSLREPAADLRSSLSQESYVPSAQERKPNQEPNA